MLVIRHNPNKLNHPVLAQSDTAPEGRPQMNDDAPPQAQPISATRQKNLNAARAPYATLPILHECRP
jgi:hypothetical protein